MKSLVTVLVLASLAGCMSDEQYGAQLVIDDCLKKVNYWPVGSGARNLLAKSCEVLQDEYKAKFNREYKR